MEKVTIKMNEKQLPDKNRGCDMRCKNPKSQLFLHVKSRALPYYLFQQDKFK